MPCVRANSGDVKILGPCHQISKFLMSNGGIPLVGMSAGFKLDLIWRQFLNGIACNIFEVLFAMKDFHFLGSAFSQAKTTVESVNTIV